MPMNINSPAAQQLSNAMDSGHRGIATCQYDASPDAALAAVRAHMGPLLVDLDETLYLRNSTEDFIDCASPGLFVLLLLRLLDVLKPWQLTGGTDTRDTWRVCVISIFFPWTHYLWRTKVRFLAENYVNRELMAALKARAQPPIVLTSGFKSIVAPLLGAMGFADAPLIAARMRSFADRSNGKLGMATREIGAQTFRRSLLITDSINDLEAMHGCARAMRTVWPKAQYYPALSSVYLPGEYISKIKRPGERYIWGAVLQEDFIFWLLSSIGLSINPTTHVIGLLMLLLSFWAIYERGYVENDIVASSREADPKLSPAFGSVHVATPVFQPWIWALLAGAVAVAFLQPETTAFLVHFGLWVAVLVLVYAIFRVFNRLDKTTRIWIYPLLQLARTASVAVIVPIEPAGAAALGAHALSRWMPYHVYRISRSSWPNVRLELVRLISFALLLILMLCVFGTSALLTWSALALLLWNIFKARRDIYSVINSARLLPPAPERLRPVSDDQADHAVPGQWDSAARRSEVRART